MDFVKHMDSIAIALLERRCHWFQRWTGKSNYWLAGKWRLAMSYAVAIGVMAHIAGANPSSSWLSFTGVKWIGWFNWVVAAVLIPDGILEERWLWKVREGEAFARLQRGLANPRKNHSFVRYLWLFFAVAHPGLFNVACLSFEWLRTCDPLPPQESKIKVFLRNFHFSKPQLATVEGR